MSCGDFSPAFPWLLCSILFMKDGINVAWITSASPTCEGILKLVAILTRRKVNGTTINWCIGLPSVPSVRFQN